MIGPIPIAFGSSPEMTVIAMVIGFLMMIAFLLLSRRSIDSGEEEERTSYEDKKDRKVKGGGMILIGPIPIVFGSDIKYTLIIMILAIILMVLAILILLLK
ncbi:MAG: TIGR00304 family protein [Candidatus Methanoperedens sp.]|nr:TIGR00304 family protein [Candidatus Methanoperedens sp.]